jgi:hypothetical protein
VNRQFCLIAAMAAIIVLVSPLRGHAFIVPTRDIYVAAGHYLQEFSGSDGTFLGNETTMWSGGTSNTELTFGPDNNLYGLGSNGWLFNYDFGSGQTSVFAKPSGDGGSTGVALGRNLNWFVAAGHHIQEFSGSDGTLIRDVTTTWAGGTGNTELCFGQDDNLYGLGSNGWIFKFDFSTGLTSVFAKPTGDGGTTGLALGPNQNWYVVAGHYIQEFSGVDGTLVGNVTTTWDGGTSNTELQFGPDGGLYGLGSNGWVFKFDFLSGQTSVFAQPSGDGGSTGLAFEIPEPQVRTLILAGFGTLSALRGSIRKGRRSQVELATN